MKKEVEFVYYTALIKEGYPDVNLQKFSEEFVRTKGATSALTKYGLNEKEYWDWSVVQHPDQQIYESESFKHFMIEYLTTDYEDAKKGTLLGPVTAAFDCLKDLRDEIRFMLDHQLFSDDDTKKWLWDWFTPLNTFLSIGPPLERTAELKALIKAGIVTIIGPKMKIETEADCFVAYSEKFPDKKYKTQFLIEARVTKTANQLSLNPLMQQLLKDKIATLHQFVLDSEEVVQTGALSVNRKTNQLLSAKGQEISGLFCYGIPTEGLHWLTAATSRPGIDPWNLREADTIAETIFENKKKENTAE